MANPAPNAGAAPSPPVDPIEARLIEIRDALERLTETLTKAQRQTMRRAA